MNQNKSWRLNRQLNVSVFVQLLFLASLILGSWINLQDRLNSLQRDVNMLLQKQENFEEKIEMLWSRSISYEYRLRTLEQKPPQSTSGNLLGIQSDQ